LAPEPFFITYISEKNTVKTERNHIAITIEKSLSILKRLGTEKIFRKTTQFEIAITLNTEERTDNLRINGFPADN
jgi:hypothetical protein